MAVPTTCPQCDAELPENAPRGICPKCLLRAGLENAQEAEPAPEKHPQRLASDFVPPDPDDLAIHFPQLEIQELLGKGGMGAVYRARQPKLDRLVAVKILPAEIGADPAFAARFNREARALAKLSHQNIVSVFDFGEVGGLYYFVMEYVDGVNLRQLIEAGGLQPKDALEIVPQICAALQFAHDEGVVHRDIKPENILVDQQGRVKIADFGLAKLLAKAPTDVTLTGDRQAMGTWHYMAPEQMRSAAAVDHRADIYSLGVVFYELLTGHLPVGRFQLPSETANVDARLDRIVLKSLEREPESRYQSASDVKTDVDLLVSAASVAVPAAGFEPPPVGMMEPSKGKPQASQPPLPSETGLPTSAKPLSDAQRAEIVSQVRGPAIALLVLAALMFVPGILAVVVLILRWMS